MAALAERAEPPELDAREAAVVLPMPPPDVIHMSPRAGPAGGAAAARTPIPVSYTHLTLPTILLV